MSALRAVEKSRRMLLASETGTILKTGHYPLEVGLVALSPYAVAMSSLGFQSVYRAFNDLAGVRCERVFCLGPEAESKRAKNWVSLESGRRLDSFAVLAVSLSYEQDCLRLPVMIAAAGLPLCASERREAFPLVFCGGPVITANPEPVAPFIDVCGIGDAEKLVPSFVSVCLEGPGKGRGREELLLELAAEEGFYLPALYEPQRESGSSVVAPVPMVKGAPEKVAKATADSLGDTPIHSVVVSGETHFKRMFLVEVARGCRWACRFCLVSSINRPYRFVKSAGVLETLGKAPPETAAVGLVGANLCDHPELDDILEGIASTGFRLGTSSLRVDTVTERLLGLLRKCRVRSVTLAPETASERLLAAVGKPGVRRHLQPVVEMIAGAGFDNLKLYYMIGLPGEEEADWEALSDQVRDLSSLLPARMNLRVSVNPFIPKPQTVWQDEPMLRPSGIKAALRRIRRSLADLRPKVTVQSDSAAGALAQAVISQGDRRVAPAIERAALSGERFLHCLEGTGFELESMLYQRREPHSVHPWRVLEA